ncbi:MAG: amidohydrolase [Actinomycetia bacterium]|nr:amidohydrolase [Actinomycetes bacterium]
MRIVAIEEHHIIPEMSSYMDLSWLPPVVQGRLHATADERLAGMDAAGIDMQVLSVVLPMPRMLPAETAVPLAAKANGELHGMVAAHPDRFAAFATLPVTVPDAAAAELERAVGELGFVGTMISGTIGGRFLDDPFFSPVLETAARLNVPVYLHPGPPPKPVADVYYTGFPDRVNQILATAGYGWHYETSLHAVRMIIGGVFDRLPELKVILGHLGEGIPFHLPRIDDMLTPSAVRLAKPVSRYFREHFWITTSGYFYDGPFRLTQETFGDDRLIFSVDYPFADNQRARDWFDRLDLAPEVREKIAHGTVDGLLRLR